MRLLLAKLVSKNINETEDNFLSNFFEILSSIPSKQIKKFMEITKDFLKELETTLQQHTYNDSYPTIPTIKTENFKDKINAHTNRISLWTGLFVNHITKQKNG
jgi:DNA-binding transcriptional regulator GbsR (MarR family)